jgi:large subunit ribosomal protein L30e
MIDIARALKTAATTGDVRFGLEETRKALKKGEAKMLVYSGSNIELGSACGKPFPISALAIVSAGESNILSA